MKSTSKTIGIIIVLLLLITTCISLNRLYSNNINWQTSLASSERFGPVQPAGVVLELNNAPSYVGFAVLAKAGSSCRYFINGNEYALPSATRTTGTYSLGRSGSIRPDTKDLKNINIDGRTWDWVTTVQKDRSSNRTIVCDGDFLLTERPGLVWYMAVLRTLLYVLYAITALLVLYLVFGFTRHKPK